MHRRSRRLGAHGGVGSREVALDDFARAVAQGLVIAWHSSATTAPSSSAGTAAVWRAMKSAGQIGDRKCDPAP